MKITLKIVKAAAADLEDVLELEESDGEASVLISPDMKLSAAKKKVIEAAEMIEKDDLSEFDDKTIKLLKALEVSLPTDDEDEDEDEDEDNKAEWTWEDLDKMSKAKLTELVEEKDLITDKDDYADVKDFRIAVAEELGIEFPEPEEEEELTLEETLQKTTKLADLKELVKDNSEFKKLRKKLDDFAGLSGPRKLKPKMLKILGIEDTPKTEKKKTEPKGPSAYGTTVDLMCANPDMTKEQLLKKLNKADIDCDGSKSAIQTGFGVVRKIAGLLKKNKLMK